MDDVTQWLVEEAVFVAEEMRGQVTDEDRAMHALQQRHAEMSALRDSMRAA